MGLSDEIAFFGSSRSCNLPSHETHITVGSGPLPSRGSRRRRAGGMLSSTEPSDVASDDSFVLLAMTEHEAARIIQHRFRTDSHRRPTASTLGGSTSAPPSLLGKDVSILVGGSVAAAVSVMAAAILALSSSPPAPAPILYITAPAPVSAPLLLSAHSQKRALAVVAMVSGESDTTRQFTFEAFAAIAYALVWGLLSSTAEPTKSKPVAAKKLQRRAAPEPCTVGNAKPQVVPVKSEIATQTPNYKLASEAAARATPHPCAVGSVKPRVVPVKNEIATQTPNYKLASKATPPTAMTWNGFQQATAGRGFSRREVAILWAEYKLGQYELPPPRPAAVKKLRHVKPVAPTTVARSVAPQMTKSMLTTDNLIKQMHLELDAFTQKYPSA